MWNIGGLGSELITLHVWNYDQLQQQQQQQQYCVPKLLCLGVKDRFASALCFRIVSAGTWLFRAVAPLSRTVADC
jgi:hypothetical protein